MQADFTLNRYKEFLEALMNQGFSFLTFEELLKTSSQKIIVLRHDVDHLPGNSLKFARLQAEIGIRGSYYFRMAQGSFDEKIIKEIYSMGHEAGYHYEDVSLTAIRLRAKGSGPRAKSITEKELVEISIENFANNLERLRKIIPVKTICMHGSPMSRWDSRLLWKYYDYKDFGIIGEPYFDIDFDEVLYLTDTGRRWDGEAVSIRDRAHDSRHTTHGFEYYKNWKVKPVKFRMETKRQNAKVTESLRDSGIEGQEDPAPSTQDPATLHKFHSTSDIIKAARENRLPDKIMMTFHPQRWNDRPVPWVKELVWQNVKNVGKYFLVKMRD